MSFPVILEKLYFNKLSIDFLGQYILGQDPVPTPTQQFTKTGDGKFSLTLALTAKEYLLLPVNGSWDAKFGIKGGSNLLGGDLVPQGDNFKAPSVAGSYKIEIDFAAGTYALTKQ